MARDYRIDSIKGLLIILVILGHAIIAIDNVNIINHAVMGAIYVFHMPLFILISGYLTKSPDQQDARSMWKSVGNLFVTLAIFHLYFSLRFYFRTGVFLPGFTTFPFGILWYLMSLIWWRIMLYYTPKKLFRRPALYLGIAIILSLACGLTRLGTLMSIQRTMNFYLFFLLGFYYRQGLLNTRWWHNNILHGTIVVVLLPIIFWLYPHCGNVMNGADYYGIEGLPQKAMILICSVATTLLVFNITRDFKWLRPIGRDSMFYYLYHIIFIPYLAALVKDYNLPQTLPFILLYTASIVVILWGLSKIKLLWWPLHPTFKLRRKS